MVPVPLDQDEISFEILLTWICIQNTDLGS